jgi:hypothetical protein
MIILASAISALQSAALEPVRSTCIISVCEHTGKLRLRIENGGCGDDGHCGTSLAEEAMDRLTGVSMAYLEHEGAQLTASLTADAGTLVCSGAVHNGSLIGDSVFTPNAAFASHMEQMGFSGLDSEKLQAYALVNVQSAWARSLQELGIQGLTADKLIPLRIFNADPEYVRSIIAFGYDLPSADQLVGMRVQGVNAEEIREIRALGYKPTFDELMQIRIFQITPEFIKNMESRGLKNLTIAKLVQIRIFKLDE